MAFDIEDLNKIAKKRSKKIFDPALSAFLGENEDLLGPQLNLENLAPGIQDRFDVLRDTLSRNLANRGIFNSGFASQSLGQLDEAELRQLMELQLKDISERRNAQLAFGNLAQGQVPQFIAEAGGGGSGLGETIGGLIGTGAGALFGGGAGAGIGGTIGSQIGGLF